VGYRLGFDNIDGNDVGIGLGKITVLWVGCSVGADVGMDVSRSVPGRSLHTSEMVLSLKGLQIESIIEKKSSCEAAPITPQKFQVILAV